MPLAGLPAAAETALNALLADDNVSSWKVVGEGASTVIVLRLEPHAHSSSASMADWHNTRGQCFRRKPPSQIRRDQERPRLRNEQSAKADRAGGNTFYFSLTFKWWHRTPPQRSVGLHARKLRLTREKPHTLRDLVQFYLGRPADVRRSAVGTARLSVSDTVTFSQYKHVTLVSLKCWSVKCIAVVSMSVCSTVCLHSVLGSVCLA